MRSAQLEPLAELQTQIRKRRMRQYEVANALGIRDDQMSLIINGRQPISENLVSRLEALFACGREKFLPTDHPLLKAANSVSMIAKQQSINGSSASSQECGEGE